MSPVLSVRSGLKAYGWSAGETGTFELISRVTLGADSGEINFSNIPQLYTHLQLRLSVLGIYTSASNGYLAMRINGVTTADYTRHIFSASDSSSGANAFTGYTTIALDRLYYNTSGNNNFSTIIADIYDYTNTNKYKTVKGIGGYHFGSGGQVAYFSDSFLKTDAVSSIRIFDVSSLLLSKYTTVGLYGIRSA